MLWAGKFQKNGDDSGFVRLHDKKTWIIRLGLHPEDNSDTEYGAKLLKTADIPEHTFDGFLVFKAEIQVSLSPSKSFKHVKDRYFDHTLEKRAFFDNLIRKFGAADSDFTVKSSDGNNVPCHKLILSAHSGYFKTLLESGSEPAFKEKIINEVSLEGIAYETLSLLLCYMYSLDLVNSKSR